MGGFLVCLIVFGGDRGKMSFVLQCFQTRAPSQLSVFKMLRPTISLEEGLPHVNEEHFSANKHVNFKGAHTVTVKCALSSLLFPVEYSKIY